MLQRIFPSKVIFVAININTKSLAIHKIIVKNLGAQILTALQISELNTRIIVENFKSLGADRSLIEYMVGSNKLNLLKPNPNPWQFLF